jgi:hypothetical protein
MNNESSSSNVANHHENNESSSSSMESASVNSKIWNFGKPIFKCRHCNALLWYEERIRPNTHTKNPYFGICYQNGKISLPARSGPPTFLEELLSGVVDKEINKGYRHYVFHMHGQNYHHIGTLLPEEGNKPRWAQLYIYDIEHEIQNRIEASKNGVEDSSIDPIIVAGLQNMIDEHNVLAKTFRMARDRFKEDDYHEYTLKLIGKRSGTHNLPSVSEVAALVV